MKFPAKKGFLKIALASAAAVALIGLWAYFIWRREIEGWLLELSRVLGEWAADFKEQLHILDNVPLICYSLVIFVLPIFFLPVTPVFVIAASRTETDSYAAVLACCILGVTMNVVASYFISKKFGVFLRNKLAVRGINVPTVKDSEEYEITFLMRMIPGNPLAVQNYVLGIAGVSFFKYAVVSLPIQWAQIAVYVYFGEGVFSGGLSKIMLASSMLLVIAVIARVVEKRYGAKLRDGKNGVSK